MSLPGAAPGTSPLLVLLPSGGAAVDRIPLVLYLGRISLQSVPESHPSDHCDPVCIADVAAGSESDGPFGVLLVCTTAVTIVVSTVLYRYLEVPGIHAGRFLARKTCRPTGSRHAQDAIVFPSGD